MVGHTEHLYRMPLMGPRRHIMHVIPSWNTGRGAPPDALAGSPLALRRLVRWSAGLSELATCPVAAGCALRVDPVAGRTLSGAKLVTKSPFSPHTTSYLKVGGGHGGERLKHTVLRLRRGGLTFRRGSR